MNRDDAATLARTLMNEHGLGDIPFEFDNRRRAFGVTHFLINNSVVTHACTVKKITLSEPLVKLNDEASVRNTILHEIAHAKAGHTAGHGYAWKKGQLCYPYALPSTPELEPESDMERDRR